MRWKCISDFNSMNILKWEHRKQCEKQFFSEQSISNAGNSVPFSPNESWKLSFEKLSMEKPGIDKIYSAISMVFKI